MQFPAQTISTEIGSQVVDVLIRDGQVQVAQQGGQVRAARGGRGRIGQHHEMRDGQWALHRLRRPSMHFIVQDLS